MSQRNAEDLDRELIELLNELRVVLPGVQVLFAFLLAVPFSSGWTRVTDLQRDVFFLAFICTAAASILLIAPSAYHRLRWREGDKEQMLRTSNRLAIAGTTFSRSDDRGGVPDRRHPLQGTVGGGHERLDRGRLCVVLVRPAA